MLSEPSFPSPTPGRGPHPWVKASAASFSVQHAKEAVFHRYVFPGQSYETAISVAAPRVPGDYVLEIDLVSHDVGSFSTLGAAPLRLPVRVKGAPVDEPGGAGGRSPVPSTGPRRSMTLLRFHPRSISRVPEDVQDGDLVEHCRQGACPAPGRPDAAREQFFLRGLDRLDGGGAIPLELR